MVLLIFCQYNNKYQKYFNNNFVIIKKRLKQNIFISLKFFLNIIFSIKCLKLLKNNFSIFLLFIIFQSCFSINIISSDSSNQQTFTEMLKIQKGKREKFDGEFVL